MKSWLSPRVGSPWRVKSRRGGDHPGADEGESIFDYGSKIGLLPESEVDYWIHDAATSTWTRVIVVPRTEFYHPSEGLERSMTPGPMLVDVGDLRKTITFSGESGP